MLGTAQLAARGKSVRAILWLCLFLSPALAVRAQEPSPDWQREVHRYSQARDWAKAFEVVNAVLARNPADVDARESQAWLFLWSGDVPKAEQGFLALTKDSPKDPDMWQGLSSVYERQGRWQEALKAIDQAIQLDPHRTDLREQRAAVLRALDRRPEARLEFMRVLEMDPSSTEAKSGLLSLQEPPKHELRIGTDEDLFNYTGAYGSEWVSLVSRWNSHWDTSIAGDFFQRAGFGAGKVIGSVTGKTRAWGALTVGGAVGHDNTIIPRSEAFFGYDRGWRISEDRFVRGVEATYDQHWYWYSSARVLTLTGGTLVYLPRDWSWAIALTGARNSFPGLAPGWQPSGITRLAFPLAHWGERRLSGNALFAVGSEDFALVEQIGSFASQTWGGGFRFQFNSRQDVTGYAAFQQRTQDHTDTSFGFSYGIHF